MPAQKAHKMEPLRFMLKAAWTKSALSEDEYMCFLPDRYFYTDGEIEDSLNALKAQGNITGHKQSPFLHWRILTMPLKDIATICDSLSRIKDPKPPLRIRDTSDYALPEYPSARIA